MSQEIGREPINQEVAQEVLRLLKSILDKHKVTFWLSFGTCLGAVREKNFIAHDYDIDLEMYLQDQKCLVALIPELTEQGFKVEQGRWGFNLHKAGISLDITFSYKANRQVASDEPKVSGWISDCFFLENASFERLEIIEFLGEEYKVPQNPANYLSYIYGPTWQTPNKENFWWNRPRFKSQNDSVRTESRNESLKLLKEIFGKYDIPFWLAGLTCRDAILHSNSIEYSDRINLNAHLDDKKKIIKILPELSELGFECIKASHIRYAIRLVRLNITIRRKDEFIDIDFAFTPDRYHEYAYGFRSICGMTRFTQKFFEQLETIDYLGESYYIPRFPRRYLSYLYGPIWHLPKFNQLSNQQQIDCLMKVLEEEGSLDLAITSPWMPDRMHYGNFIISHGDIVVIKTIEQPICKGMFVLANLSGSQDHSRSSQQLSIQRVIDIKPDGGILLTRNLSKVTDTWCDEKSLLGHVSTLHSRLGVTVSLDNRLIQIILKLILPVLYTRKF